MGQTGVMVVCPSFVTTCSSAGELGRSGPCTQPASVSARYWRGVHWEKSAFGIPLRFIGVSRVTLCQIHTSTHNIETTCTVKQYSIVNDLKHAYMQPWFWAFTYVMQAASKMPAVYLEERTENKSYGSTARTLVLGGRPLSAPPRLDTS